MPVQPPPPPVPFVEVFRPRGPGSVPRTRLAHNAQQSQPLPQFEVAVEVTGHLPVDAKLEDLTRRLGARQRDRRSQRVYPPTILELVTLVKRNPERPRNKEWRSITALSVRFDPEAKLVTVEYCVEHCGFNPRTGALDDRRRLVSYSAPEAQVISKADKKLEGLKKYAAPPSEP